ncbi:thiol-activated cytolysin family protein [Flavobacteriaceae bacterium KMM 6898]|nr:thiol-activated cytolysin family protein [Flavobacteriaceae bacterium KMM 6898]
MKTLTNLRNKCTPNWEVRPILIFGVLLVLLFFTACSKDEATTEDPNSEDPKSELTFAQVVAAGGEFEPFPEFRTTTDVGEPSTANRDDVGVSSTERFSCTTRTVSVLDGNGAFPLFNSGAEVIYPGNLLQGKTLSDVTPKPIVVARAGGTISHNLINGSDPSFTVDEVKKSTIATAMNSIIDKSTGPVPAKFEVDIVQIESESQMALEIGIEVENLTTSAQGNLSFSSEKEFNRTLVKVVQEYYTMSFDLPTSLDQIFAESITPEQLQPFVQEDNPATFISSVTYGRVFYMLIESTSSREEMQASLNITYDSGLINGSSSLDVNTFASLKEVKIKAIAYGGDAVGSFELLGETNIAAIAQKIGAATNIKTGLPLSYVVRSVERPDIVVGTKLATKYDIVTCSVKGYLALTIYKELVDIFGPGPGNGIGAATKVSGEKFIVYNITGDKYALYDAGLGKKGAEIYDITDGPFRLPASFGPVGAAILYRANEIRFFDKEKGLKFISMKSVNSSWAGDLAQEGWLNSSNVNYYSRRDDNEQQTNDFYSENSVTEFPFSADGIGAATAHQAVRDAGLDDRNHQFYFSLNGNAGSVYRSALHPYTGFSYQSNWNGKFTIDEFFNDKFPTDFDRVGAAVKITFSANSISYLYFNETGDRMMIQNEESNEYEGPFVVN